MRYIRNFFHNINDVLLAIIIVALAAGIIYWRMQIILDYPKQLADEQVVYDDAAEDAEADTTDAEAAVEADAAADSVEESDQTAADDGQAADGSNAEAEQPQG